MAPLPQYNYFKITPPARRVGLARERLVSRLCAEGLQAKLTLLCAEAGYGKTTLLRQFADATSAKVAWYRLGNTDRDLTQFVTYLAEAVRQHFPGFALNSSQSGAESSAWKDPQHLAFAFAHEFGHSLDQPLVIVLDNYEKVCSSPPVVGLVHGLVEYLPPSVHLFVASRQKPDLPLGRLRAEGDLCEVSQQDLAFTVDEIQAYLARNYDLNVQGDELGLLIAKTEGWAAGIVMAALRLRQAPGEMPLRSLNTLSGGSKAIYDYLAEEVFAGLEPSVQSFLVKTAILSRLSVHVCNQLLGIGNSQQVLMGLEDCGLFTHSTGEGRDLFRYHRLFREFLVEQLHQRLSPPEVRALHLRAATILSESGQYAEALEQYAEAGELGAAADLVERLAERYLDCGMLETVQHWLSIIPESVVSARPWMQTLRARMLRRIGDYPAALGLLQRASVLFRRQQDKTGLAAVIHEMGFTNYRLGRYSETVRLAEGVLGEMELDTAERARLLSTLCLSYTSMDETERAIQCGETALREVLDLPRDVASATLLTRTNRFMARAYARQGRLQSAMQAAERALDMCRYGEVEDLELAWAQFTRGLVLTLSGELDLALQALKAAEAAGGLNRCWQRERISFWMGNALRDKGDLVHAAKAYEDAGPLAIAEQAYLLLRQERLSEAMSLAQEGCRFFEARESPGDTAVARATLALVLKARGQTDLARRHLEAARAVFAEKGLEQRLASACLLLARLEFEAGDIARAANHLRKAMDVATLLDLHHFRWWDPAAFAFLAGQALKLGIQPHHVGEIVRAKLRTGRAAELASLLNFPDGNVQSQVSHIFEDVAREASADPDLAQGLLADCPDQQLRSRLTVHLSGGHLSVDELAQLHSRYGLTWREIEVFCEYYLQTSAGKRPEGLGRGYYARQLCMSENTLKVHINNIRRKLGMVERTPGQRGPIWIEEGRRVL